MTPLLPQEGVGNTGWHQLPVTGLGCSGVTPGQDKPRVVQPLLLPAAKAAASTPAQKAVPAPPLRASRAWSSLGRGSCPCPWPRCALRSFQTKPFHDSHDLACFKQTLPNRAVQTHLNFGYVFVILVLKGQFAFKKPNATYSKTQKEKPLSPAMK